MTDNVANLGFSVDSKPLEDATKKLSDVASQADKTGKAVDDFNQKVSKTSNEASKAGDGVGKIGPALSAVESAARRAGTSIEEMRSRTAAFNTETAKISAAVAAANTTLAAHAVEVGKAATAHAGLSAQQQAAFHLTRNLAEAFASGTVSAQTFTQQIGHLSYASSGPGGLTSALSGVARMIGPGGLIAGGIAGLGALAVALEKVSDEANRSKLNFGALAGSADAGNSIYKKIADTAHDSSLEFGALSKAVQQASQGFEIASDKHVIYANSADKARKDIESLTAAFGIVGKAMQRASTNAEEEKTILDALAGSLAKTATITDDAFQKIRDTSPAVALAIANAFGYKTLEEFQKQLALTPIGMDDFIKQMERAKPAIERNFDARPINTVKQATEELAAGWDRFIKSLADAGGFNVAIGAINGMTAAVKGLSAALNAASNAKDVLAGKGQGASSSSTYDAVGNVTGSSGEPATYTGDYSFNNSSYINNGTFDYLTGAGQVGNPMGDMPAFAGGGQLTVGGDGGTDTTLVQFKATKGEVVEVKTAEQVAAEKSSGIQGLTMQGQSDSLQVTPDPAQIASVKEITDAINQSTIDITKKVSDGSDNIVSALNKLMGGVSASTVNPLTGLPLATSTGSSLTANSTSGLSFGGSGSGGGLSSSGGGGFSTKSGGGMGDQEARDRAQSALDNPPLTPQQAAMYAAMGASVVRGQAVPIGPGGNRYRRISWPQQQANRRFPYRNPINPDGSNSSGGSGGDYGGGFDYGAATVGEPTTSAYDDYGSSYDGGGDFGVGGSTVWDVAQQYMSGFDQPFGSAGINGGGSWADQYLSGGWDVSSSGWGNDTGWMNYGGGSYDAGYFATGGKFTVPGAPSSGDKTLVTMHANPGEDVYVVPNGSTPNGVNVQQPASTGAMAPPADPSVTQTIKNITINVQSDIQARDMIRSRAQIARSL